jgi:two-component system NtrC family sensor kinase
MDKIQAFFKINFSTKVLAPVVATMMALIALTAWTVNRLMTQQFESEASLSLRTAEWVLRKSQKTALNNLGLRFRNLVNEPRYRAAFKTGNEATIRGEFDDLLLEQEDIDAVAFTWESGKESGKTIAKQRRNAEISLSSFETNSGTAVQRALETGEGKDTILAGDRLMNIVSVSFIQDDLVGVITFGSEVDNRTLSELKPLEHTEIALLAHGRVLASTFARSEVNTSLSTVYRAANDVKHGARRKTVVLDNRHYYYAVGGFETLNARSELGFLLLSAYEEGLRDLQSKQQMLILESTLAVLFGMVVVWYLVRRATEPVRQLRDSAEAVGKGDFSRRVEVKSGDECGELAWVFNQMTENLQRSREQLEQTVDTLKTTQAQLVQSEKLSGIGEFVAGVAHELNNPLTSVMGFSELLAKADTTPKQKRHLDMVHKSAQRCHKIVQSLLSFARKHQPERKPANINELIGNAVEFLQYQLRTSNIEVETKLEPKLPLVMIDPHQVQQVFLNIINNGRQAIEAHQPGGLIRISSEKCGDHLRVVFEDNGPGISEKNLCKVFDPFFTTKEVGKGTGLGLSLCYGIIKEHGGMITVKSKPGEGATFVLDLPVSPCPMQPVAQSPGKRPLATKGDGAGKRVLVIDDEEPILEMLKETLAQEGYQVDTASDGESGLRRLNQLSYDLTLCDWKMPGLSGQEVYERVRVSNPAVSNRMIFITGDVISPKTQAFLEKSKRRCLSKPFSLEEFREAVSAGMTAS